MAVCLARTVPPPQRCSCDSPSACSRRSQEGSHHHGCPAVPARPTGCHTKLVHGHRHLPDTHTHGQTCHALSRMKKNGRQSSVVQRVLTGHKVLGSTPSTSTEKNKSINKPNTPPPKKRMKEKNTLSKHRREGFTLQVNAEAPHWAGTQPANRSLWPWGTQRHPEPRPGSASLHWRELQIIRKA